MDNRITKKEANLFCNICAKHFKNKSSFINHNKWKHETKAADHRCKVCDKTFTRKFSLVKHMKKCNESNINDPNFIFKCSICDVPASSRLTIFNHYRDDHKIDLNEKHLKFKTLSEFKEWKYKFECHTKSQFFKIRGTYQNKRGKKIMQYSCHRDGKFKINEKNIRHIKLHGSNKIKTYCPARINMCVNSEDITVRYIDTHIGHKLELGHIYISKSERDDIAEKVALNIPVSVILDEICDSSLKNNESNKNHLLTRKDHLNMVASYNSNHETILSKSNCNSVDAWVSYMRSTSNTIRFYKPQNVVSEEYPELDIKDFFLIIMNNAQLEILKKFGEDCICVDGTHGLNPYDIQLYSIMVLDDTKQGFPCCFMFSNRCDTLAMKIFFETVKLCLNDNTIVPNTFMSDIEKTFYNAWLTVMGPAKHQLYCSWHVDREWRKNLNKIKGQEAQVLIYKKLKILQFETDVRAFKMMMETFFLELSTNPNIVEFTNYFIPYKNMCSSWAYCYHKLCDVNMNLERMHRVIEHMYSDGQKVKKLNIAIHILMKFIRDKLYDRTALLNKEKLVHKLQDVRTKHKKAQLLFSNVIIKKDGDNSWNIIISNKKNIYKVTKNTDTHNICELYCNECNSCIHKFSCTCIDFSIQWNMCQHIHLVCLKEDDDSKEIKLFDINEGASISRQLSADVNEQNAVVNKRSLTIGDETFKQMKERLLAKHAAIFSMIENENQLKAVAKYLVPLEHIVKSFSNARSVSPPLLVMINSEPEHKKIKTQNGQTKI